MNASTIWLLLPIVVLIGILVFWEPLIGGGFPSLLPALGLVLLVFIILLVAMPESRNGFRLVFPVLAAQRAMARGDYDAADRDLRRALALAERTGRAIDQNLGQVLFHLAELHRQLGRYGESELIYLQALRHLREAFKPTHRFRIYARHNLGVVYILQGRYAEAEPVCAAALDLMIAKFGTAHGHTAVSRCNLGKCLQGQGRLAEAEELYGQALRQLEVSRRPDDRMTRCACRHNLAELRLEQGRWSEAEPLLRQSLAELDQDSAGGKQEAARHFHTLSEVARQSGNLEAAEELCQLFLQKAEAAFPAQHPALADGWLTQARLRAAEGKLTEAAELYQRCWTVWEPLLAPEHARRARCCQECADVLLRLGREDEATQLTARSKQSPVWVQAADDLPH
jgi:tetratricopeptide (TPR) repeat protein